MKTLTLYLGMPNLTFYFNATSDNTPLFNGNGKVNREVLEKKKQEIFGQKQLPAGQAVANIPSIEECLANFRRLSCIH